MYIYDSFHSVAHTDTITPRSPACALFTVHTSSPLVLHCRLCFWFTIVWSGMFLVMFFPLRLVFSSLRTHKKHCKHHRAKTSRARCKPPPGACESAPARAASVAPWRSSHAMHRGVTRRVNYVSREIPAGGRAERTMWPLWGAFWSKKRGRGGEEPILKRLRTEQHGAKPMESRVLNILCLTNRSNRQSIGKAWQSHAEVMLGSSPHLLTFIRFCNYNSSFQKLNMWHVCRD